MATPIIGHDHPEIKLFAGSNIRVTNPTVWRQLIDRRNVDWLDDVFKIDVPFVEMPHCVPERGLDSIRQHNQQPIELVRLLVRNIKPSLYWIYNILRDSLDAIAKWPQLNPHSFQLHDAFEKTFRDAVDFVQLDYSPRQRMEYLRIIDRMIDFYVHPDVSTLYSIYLRHVQQALEKIAQQLQWNSYQGHGDIEVDVPFPYWVYNGRKWTHRISQLSYLYHTKIQVSNPSQAMVDTSQSIMASGVWSNCPILADTLEECGLSKESEWFLGFLREGHSSHFNMQYAAFRQLKGEMVL